MQKFLAVILLCFNMHSLLVAQTILSGHSCLNNGEYNSLKVSGSFIFNNVTVKKLLTVSGSSKGKNLKAKKAKFNGSCNIDGLQAQSLKCSGSFTGKNIEVKGCSTFKGSVNVTKGVLGDIKISSQHPTLKDMKVKGKIIIKKTSSGWNIWGLKFGESSSSVLELRGDSCVEGDIIFENEGEVHLFGEAEIKGKVINAKVVKK